MSPDIDVTQGLRMLQLTMRHSNLDLISFTLVRPALGEWVVCTGCTGDRVFWFYRVCLQV